MTNQRKISRREAIKILGATAGASLLANLPSKWSTPELNSGILPAHAQTSCLAMSMTLSSLTDFGVASFVEYLPGPLPDVQTGAVYAYDGSNHAPVPLGYSANWGCQSGCLHFGFGVSQGSASAFWDITLNGIDFQIGLNAILVPVAELLVNLETGEYTTNINETAGGCNWAF